MHTEPLTPQELKFVQAAEHKAWREKRQVQDITIAHSPRSNMFGYDRPLLYQATNAKGVS